MSSRPQEFVYGTDLMLSDPRELGTLAIFYDRVLLPFSTPASSRDFVELEVTSSQIRVTAFAMNQLSVTLSSAATEVVDDQVVEWEKRNRELFDEGALARLPEPRPADDILQNVLVNRISLTPLREAIRRCRNTYAATLRPYWYIREDLLRHLLRADLNGSFLLSPASPASPERESMKQMLADRVIRYLLPLVSELRPSEILEVRHEVSSTREGFAMHLQSLTVEIESRIQSGDALAEVARYASAVAETTLLPDYAEFRRQILAKRSGFWSKVLDITGRILEIDVAPWTPKFYGQILQAIGAGAAISADERLKELSNKSQALRFMHAIDGAADHHSQPRRLLR
jgi:hypothetical protein